MLDKNYHIKLIDFGFSCVGDFSSSEDVGGIMNPQYSAPEMMLPDTMCGKAVDWWALGCLVSVRCGCVVMSKSVFARI